MIGNGYEMRSAKKMPTMIAEQARAINKYANHVVHSEVSVNVQQTLTFKE